jgi:hypothetical protein
MERYDPEVAPSAGAWLALDEGERILLIENYHRDARADIPRAGRRLHASIHVVVENQLALNDEPVVRAFTRLRKEGLSRHDTVHAIGSVVAEWLYDIQKEQHTQETARAHYYAAVERLTAATWRGEGGD